MQRILHPSKSARALASIMILLCANAPVRAQSEAAWFFTSRIYRVYYDNGFAYKPSWGGGFEGGRAFRNHWHLGLSGAYQLVSQPLVLFGEAHEAKTEWYRLAAVFQKHWRWDKKNRVAVFAEAEGGLLYLRARALQFSGGVQGAIVLPANRAMKFSPALGAGLRVRVSSRWEVLCSVKHHLVPGRERRLENAATKRVWQWYRQFGAGARFFL